MKKYKIIALFGKSGAGKDTIQQWIIQKHPFHGIVSCTTRPPRDYEVDGKDYHFLSNEEFATQVLNGSMLEATEFRGWFYGTALSSLDIDNINIGVFNINGIETLLDDSRLEVYPVLVYAPDKLRLLRQLNREKTPDCAEICRRFQTDERDFEECDFDPIFVWETFDHKDMYEQEQTFISTFCNLLEKIQSFIKSDSTNIGQS